MVNGSGDILGEVGSDGSSGASNQWLDRVLNTGLGVAGLFTNRTPAAQKTGTPGATNWTLIAVIGGAVVLVLVLVMSLRK